jgi:hypothetical protein
MRRIHDQPYPSHHRISQASQRGKRSKIIVPRELQYSEAARHGPTSINQYYEHSYPWRL